MIIKSKMTSWGLVELKEEGGWYCLYIDGVNKKNSKDLTEMLNDYEYYK